MGWEIVVIGLIELTTKAVETGLKIYDAATAPSGELKKKVVDAVVRLSLLVEKSAPAEWAASDAAARAEIEAIPLPGQPGPIVSTTAAREDDTKPGG